MSKELTGTIMEMTSFQLTEGISETDFLKAVNTMQKGFLDHQPGFIDRKLTKDENGWQDVVQWKTRESLKQAMKDAENSEFAASFMQMIDFESVQMKISEVIYFSN